MGVFVTSRAPEYVTAYAGSPGAGAEATTSGGGPDQPKIRWDRLLGALLVLIIVLVASIYCEERGLEKMGAVLIHSFEALLGIVVGFLGGELSSQK